MFVCVYVLIPECTTREAMMLVHQELLPMPGPFPPPKVNGKTGASSMMEEMKSCAPRPQALLEH